MVYIILVNWRGYIDTIECLESLLRLSFPSFKVIVVDNESIDDGVETIRRWACGEYLVNVTEPVWDRLPKARNINPEVLVVNDKNEGGGSLPLITVVRKEKNLGFAGGNNIGIDFALKDSSCKYVWLLNNDTIVDPGSLNELVDRVNTGSGVGICGSSLLYYDQPNIIQSLGGVFNIYTGKGSNLWAGKELQNIPDRKLVENKMSFVVGASMLLTRRFVMEIGLMEDSYFLYFEELDWRVRSKGKFELAWAPKSLVYHKEGGSIGTSSRGRSSDTAIYYLSVNFLRFMRKYYPLILPLSSMKVIFSIFKQMVKMDWRAVSVICHALFDFYTNRYRNGAYKK